MSTKFVKRWLNLISSNHINYFYIIFPKVRCSLEDVADNMVSSQLARGEKESMVIRALCETLSKTGSSSEIVATTMMSALKRVLSETKSDCDIMKAIGNTMHEQGTESEYIFTNTMQSFRKKLRRYFILAGAIHQNFPGSRFFGILNPTLWVIMTMMFEFSVLITIKRG